MYNRSHKEILAVDNIDLQVKKGEFIGIIGSSGCGKSTLLNMITGLLKPTSGEILFNGKDITKMKAHQVDNIRSRNIGYVMQGQNLLSNLKIADNLYLPQLLTGVNEDIDKKIDDVLELVGLCDTKYAYPSELSGGELKRISIARAILYNPIMIIADEPTGNLDPDNTTKIIELFQSISNKGVSVIVSTHDYKFLDYTDKLYKMDNGAITSHSFN
jgi:ABC-type lipoprotein export system ATPase subunit